MATIASLLRERVTLQVNSVGQLNADIRATTLLRTN